VNGTARQRQPAVCGQNKLNKCFGAPASSLDDRMQADPPPLSSAPPSPPLWIVSGRPPNPIPSHQRASASPAARRAFRLIVPVLALGEEGAVIAGGRGAVMVGGGGGGDASG